MSQSHNTYVQRVLRTFELRILLTATYTINKSKGFLQLFLEIKTLIIPDIYHYVKDIYIYTVYHILLFDKVIINLENPNAKIMQNVNERFQAKKICSISL